MMRLFDHYVKYINIHDLLYIFFCLKTRVKMNAFSIYLNPLNTLHAKNVWNVF